MSGDPNEDSDVTNDEVDRPIEAGPLRFDPMKDIPGLYAPIGGVDAALRYADEGEWPELVDIGGGVAHLGLNVFGYASDPLNYLTAAGLRFLLDVVQPLEDALALVTGNPERMEAEIGKWERVGTALAPLADEIRDAADAGLIGWKGEAADAAKKRLHEFADGVAGVGNDVDQLVMIMGIAKTLMMVAQAFVLSVLATFVEWLVYTWTAALAAAVPTFGASTAAAGTATGLQAALATSRVARFVTKVVTILKRLRRVLTRMHPRIMRRVQASFQRRGPDGRFVAGWRGIGTTLQGSLTDPRTYLGTVVMGSHTAVSEAGRAAEAAAADDGSMSGPARDRALDPER